MTSVTELLDQLADVEDGKVAIRLFVDEQKDKLIPAEVKQAIADLDSEVSPRLAAMDERIAELTEQIKQAVIAAGDSIKGGRKTAVFTKGRTSWDSRGLDGYAVAHPEINVFRKTGEPSVSIRNK